MTRLALTGRALPRLEEPRAELLIERAARTGETLRCGTVLDLFPPAEIDAAIRVVFDELFEAALLDEIARPRSLDP